MEEETGFGGQAQPPETATPPAAIPEPVPGLTTGRWLALLLPGLFPVLGIAICILWAYGPDGPAWRRGLAKAMLVIHGAALALLVVCLLAWVVLLLNSRTQL